MPIDWKARIAAAQAKKEAASALMSEDDRAEHESRETEARLLAEAAAAEKAKRDLDLARRMDVARERLGSKAKIAEVVIDGYADTFIVKHSAKAHAKWERDIAEAAGNKKIDKAEVARAYAVEVVEDWNGETDFSMTSVNGFKLIQHFKDHPGMVTPIVNAAAKLAGFFAEERKSGG